MPVPSFKKGNIYGFAVAVEMPSQLDQDSLQLVIWQCKTDRKTLELTQLPRLQQLSSAARIVLLSSSSCVPSHVHLRLQVVVPKSTTSTKVDFLVLQSMTSEKCVRVEICPKNTYFNYIYLINRWSYADAVFTIELSALNSITYQKIFLRRTSPLIGTLR